MGRAVGDPNPKAETSARNLVDVGGACCEFLRRLGIDRRDRGAEGDPLGCQRQTRALRHVAVPARRINAGKPAPLDLTRDVERLTPPAGHGDEADRGQRLRHRWLRQQELAGITLLARTSYRSQGLTAWFKPEFNLKLNGRGPVSSCTATLRQDRP